MITKEYFEETALGEKVYKFIFTNKNNYSIHLLSYGLSIQKIIYPDGQDIVLGFEDLNSYETNDLYIGCIVGRNANRLSEGTILLDEKEVQLTQNDGDKQLHGGNTGFQKRNWDCSIQNIDNKEILIAKYVSKHLEEGFPGELNVTVSFELTDKNTLEIGYTATTDKTTIVNLTRHDYFNLKDGGKSSINDHLVKLNASEITVNNSEGIPTGEIKKINHTALDFTKETEISSNLKKDAENLKMGYDHNFIIKKNSDNLAVAGKATDPNSGRHIEICTTQPGVQFYTSGYLNGIKGKNGIAYNAFNGFCMEGQHFPDATKHKHFKSTILRPNQTYEEQLVYKFNIKK